MAKLVKAMPGDNLHKNVGCFPLYFDGRQPRAITSNPWAFVTDYLSERLDATNRRRGMAYVDQAYEFFEAARTYAKKSRPLLLYYSYLNLAKAVLVAKGVNLPLSAKHGISDPRINVKENLKLGGQKIRIESRAQDNSNIFPELAHLLDGDHLIGKSHHVIYWFGWVPSIHRTFSEVMDYYECLLPIDKLEVLYDNGYVWTRIYFGRGDKNKESLRKEIIKKNGFRKVFHQVDVSDNTNYCYESIREKGRTKAIDQALNRLAKKVRSIGLTGILTTNGYRLYFGYSRGEPFVPGPLAAYGAVFYLGSLVRYKPQDFETLVCGKYRWIIEEFLETEPSQFVYQMAALLSGREVTRPTALKI